jgi:hypothetical protein
LVYFPFASEIIIKKLKRSKKWMRI